MGGYLVKIAMTGARCLAKGAFNILLLAPFYGILQVRAMRAARLLARRIALGALHRCGDIDAEVYWRASLIFYQPMLIIQASRKPIRLGWINRIEIILIQPEPKDRPRP